MSPIQIEGMVRVAQYHQISVKVVGYISSGTLRIEPEIFSDAVAKQTVAISIIHPFGLI